MLGPRPNHSLLQPSAHPAPPPQEPDPRTPTHADILRGAYGPDRANNDLLYYQLDIRVDSDKVISGKNTIRFKMLVDVTRIQIDFIDTLNIDKILLGPTLSNTPATPAASSSTSSTPQSRHDAIIDFFLLGPPVETGRLGVFTFKQDVSGHPWINTACEGIGASLWGPK